MQQKAPSDTEVITQAYTYSTSRSWCIGYERHYL